MKSDQDQNKAQNQQTIKGETVHLIRSSCGNIKLNWNFDQDLIGAIQFDHTLTQQQQTRLIQLIENEEKIKMTGINIKQPLNRKQKNRLISLIEAEEERQTEIEINGSKRNVNGYFQ